MLKRLFNIELEKGQYKIEQIENHNTLFTSDVLYRVKFKIFDPKFEDKLRQKNYFRIPIDKYKVPGGTPIILDTIKKGYYMFEIDSLHPENRKELIYDSNSKELIIFNVII